MWTGDCTVPETSESGRLAEIRLEVEAGEVIQVEISLRDAAGLLVTSDIELTYTLEGDGKIMGIDNGRPDDLAPYYSHTRETFNGQAIVYIRPGTDTGVLRVSGPSGMVASTEL